MSTRSTLKTHQLPIAMCLVGVALTTAFAQAPPADARLAANSAYKENCAKCHGKTGEGRHFGGPSLISERTAVTSTEDLRNIIANGKGHMPKFAGKLASEEIDTLVREVQALNRK